MARRRHRSREQSPRLGNRCRRGGSPRPRPQYPPVGSAPRRGRPCGRKRRCCQIRRFVWKDTQSSISPLAFSGATVQGAKSERKETGSILMNTTVNQICRICGLPDGVDVKSNDDSECWTVRCPICGDFTITQSVIDRGLSQSTRRNLSAWTRDKKESGQAAPLVSQDSLDAIISSFPSYSVADKQRLLMQTLAELTSHPGESVYLKYSSLWPRVWASGSEETHYLADKRGVGRWRLDPLHGLPAVRGLASQIRRRERRLAQLQLGIRRLGGFECRCFVSEHCATGDAESRLLATLYRYQLQLNPSACVVTERNPVD